MWIISKEGLIVIGVVAVLGIIGLVLLLQPARPPVALAPAETSTVPRPAEVAAVVVTPPAPAVPPTPPTPPAPPVPVTPTVPPAVATGAASAGPVTAIDGVVYAGEYAHSTEAAGFEIHWSNDAQTLRVGLISPGLGYLAFGIDPATGMQGANFILGAVTNGHLTVRDDFGTGPTAHAADVSIGGRDDILEVAGCEANGRTYLEFVIPLDSGDAADKRLVPGATYKVLIAYHETSDDLTAWHSRRGSGSITLDPA